MTQSPNKTQNENKYWTIVAFLLIAMVVFQIVNIPFTSNESATRMIQDSISRLAGVSAYIIVLILSGYKRMFNIKITTGLFLSVVVPGLIVAFINFPLSAYVNGRFEILEPGYVGYLFIGASIITAIFEEIVFRGIILMLLLYKLPHTRQGIIEAVLLSSLFFGFIHIVNLFMGSSVFSVLPQIAYSFLMGSLWAVVYLRTGSIWYPIILHAVYNILGQILYVLGNVYHRYDLFTVVTMSVVGSIIGIWTIQLLLNTTSEDVTKILHRDI